MSNNDLTGIVLSKEAAKIILDSGVLDQIREELWELNDPETVQLALDSRQGKTHPIPFDDFAKQHGV